jgi:hypothetical protein
MVVEVVVMMMMMMIMIKQGNEMYEFRRFQV